MKSSSLAGARFGVSLLFFLHGLIVATWISRIPSVQAGLRLSPGDLGFALLGAAIGSLITMPVTGWLIARFGSRPVVAVSSFAFCAVLPLPGLASSQIFLLLALVCFGGAAGAMDVSMNAQGVTLEKAYGQPVMSGFHALFSLGGMAGAGLGGWIAAQGVAPVPQFAGSALVFAVLTAAALPPLLPANADAVPHAPVFFHFPRRMLPLGMLAFFILLGEGAMADWTTVYLNRSLQAKPDLAAWGYGIFSAAMAVGRLIGDALTQRFGRPFLVRSGTLLAAAGLTAALVIGNIPAALAGFGCVGAGFSIVVPIVFAAAGRSDLVSAGTGLAAVTTIGYLGFLAGPPLIGYTADLFTLRVAMGIIVALSLASAACAGAVKVQGPSAQRVPVAEPHSPG